MISAPLGDFRHTMHIGRGGDAFGDTSFLSMHGPSPPSSDPEAPDNLPAADSQTPTNHSDLATDGVGSPQNNDLQHSESVSSFTLDLDLGPSILGDVLGVMDGLGLDSDWTSTNEEEVFSPNSSAATVEKHADMMTDEKSVSLQNELNEQKLVGMDGDQAGERGEDKSTEGNGIKPKGLRPKVRFSDKREEIIRQASEEEGQGFDFQDEDELECGSPTVGEGERGGTNLVSGEETAEVTNHSADVPPSPASSHSSEYEDVIPLDRRRVDSCHSETDSEEEEEEEGGDGGRGYTFEDEFDDEIGL